MNAIAQRLEFFYGGKIPVSIDPDDTVHLDAPLHEIMKAWEAEWAENKDDIRRRVFRGYR